MNTNQLKDGVVAEHSVGIGTVTRQMLKERAVELALIDGRLVTEVSKSDWEQAKRELTGDSNAESGAERLEAAPESERWDPVPGSIGHIVIVAPGEDEDEEGRSDNERLVAEGVAEAQLDQSLQATIAANQKENGEG